MKVKIFPFVIIRFASLYFICEGLMIIVALLARFSSSSNVFASVLMAGTTLFAFAPFLLGWALWSKAEWLTTKVMGN